MMNVLRMASAAFMSIALLLGSGVEALDKNDKKRAKIMRMHDETIAELKAERPQAQSLLDDAAGYAVFSNIGVQVLLIGGGGGSGVAIDPQTGAKTYMKMGRAGVGLGLGVKDYRVVMIFAKQSDYNDFIEKGWDFTGEADAAAKSGEKGGEVGEGSNIDRDVTVFTFTKAGLALAASLNGTKYWQWKKLNK